jgi:hypothetical protein
MNASADVYVREYQRRQGGLSTTGGITLTLPLF